MDECSTKQKIDRLPDPSFAQINHSLISVECRRSIANTAANLSSAITGGIAYASLSGTPAGRPGALAAAAATGAVTNAGVKIALESACLAPTERDLNDTDLVWGALNGITGGAAEMAETAISKVYFERVGFRALGLRESRERLQEAGFRMCESSIVENYKLNILRGCTGGATGTFVLAGSHNLAEALTQRVESTGDRSTDGDRCLQMLEKTAGETAMGALTGGAIAAAGTTAMRLPDLLGYARACISPDRSLTKVLIAHVNDLHSPLIEPGLDGKGSYPFARLATATENLRQEAQEKGVTFFTTMGGDEFGGTELDRYSEFGKAENEAIEKALHPTVRIIGNHATDKSGSLIPWLNNTFELHQLTGKSNTVVSNLTIEANALARESVAGSPSGTTLSQPLLSLFKNGNAAGETLLKPYSIHPIGRIGRIGRAGDSDQIGFVGLVTEELSANGVTVNGAAHRALPAGSETDRYARSAELAIARLKAENPGCNKVVVVSHIGRAHDLELAKRVPGISAIVGAHSHDAEPAPCWVKGPAGWNVPVVQAGNDLKWLGRLELSFKKNSGQVDKYTSKGSLIPLNRDIPQDPHLSELLEARGVKREFERLTAVGAEQQTGSTVAKGSEPPLRLPREYSGEDVRARETDLANLVSDALLTGINRHLEDSGNSGGIDAFLKHSGDIRKSLPGGSNLSDWHFVNLFCNGENSKELCIASMTGEQVRRALEFGVRDMAAPISNDSFWTRFFKSATIERPDYSGNFLQTSGLKYEFDLSKPAGNRVRNISVWRADPVQKSATSGSWQKVEGDETYMIGTLYHPVEKWAKSEIFDDFIAAVRTDNHGSEFTRAERIGLTRKLLKVDEDINRSSTTGPTGDTVCGVGLSQPRLLKEYLRGNTISRVDGRIKNVTPVKRSASWRAIAACTVYNAGDAGDAGTGN